MATWITHLRIAENLYSSIEDLDEAYFAIGNVAPDSGVPDESWENFDPPPQVTHFKLDDNQRQHRTADLKFYRNYLLPALDQQRGIKERTFLLGYFFHLVTDNLWSAAIGKPTRRTYKAQFEAEPRAFIREVKRDWYGLDFDYVRNHPDCLFWRIFLTADYEYDFLPFLPCEAIQRNLEYVRQFYQRTDDEVEEWYIKRPAKYLSEDEVAQFVKMASETLLQIYDRFCKNRTETTGYLSVLEID